MHVGQHGRELLDGVDEGDPFEERALVPQQPVELGRVVVAEPAPEHEQMARRDDRGRVELQRAKPPHLTRDYTPVDAAYDTAARIARGES